MKLLIHPKQRSTVRSARPSLTNKIRTLGASSRVIDTRGPLQVTHHRQLHISAKPHLNLMTHGNRSSSCGLNAPRCTTLRSVAKSMASPSLQRTVVSHKNGTQQSSSSALLKKNNTLLLAKNGSSSCGLNAPRIAQQYQQARRLCTENNNRFNPDIDVEFQHSFNINQISTSLYQPGGCIISHKEEPATHSLFFFHGLGDNSSSYIDAMKFLLLNNMEHSPTLRVVLPNAPVNPVTINDGHSLPSWYDILDLEQLTHCPGIENSRKLIQPLIEEELKLLKSRERIFLAGFSQGGTLSVYAGLNPVRDGKIQTDHFGGIASLSGYVPEQLPVREISEISRQTDVLACHGQWDEMVPFQLGRRTFERLANDSQMDVRWVPGNYGHEIYPEVWYKFSSWIEQRMNESKTSKDDDLWNEESIHPPQE